MQKLQEKLSAFIGVLSANPYILAIRNAMLAYMPFTIIASIFLILANMPFEGFNTFVSSITGLEAAVWQGKLMTVYFVSLNIAGFLVLLTASYAIAQELEIENVIQVLVTNVIAFLGLFPLGEGNTMALGDLGATSMFCAIIVALVGARLYKFISDKGIKIKMPDSVPPAVSAPFEAPIPSSLVIILFWVIRLLTDAFGTTLVAVPTGLIQLPWTMPVILSGFMVTQSISGAVLQIVQLVVATLFWLPFMRSADREIYEAEKAAEAAAKEG